MDFASICIVSLCCTVVCGCVHMLFLSVLMSVLCWLCKNNLDAFLFPSVLEHFHSKTIVVLLKLLKNLRVKASEPDTFVAIKYFEKNYQNFFP